MKYEGRNLEYFELTDVTSDNCHLLKSSKKSELSMIWFDEDDNHLKIDAVDYHFNKNELVCFTEFHKVEVVKVNQLRLLRWNRPFYCILDHDSEVGCKGVLYYGASNTPIVKPNEKELEILEAAWKMLHIEMTSVDNLQLEMLQMMLKRILILCTRIYKKQQQYDKAKDQVDIIRDFNFLVEQHFKEKHNVAEYADLLNKSPKTLSNLFKKLGAKTPLQFIQSRIMVESRRLLSYTDKGVSEIGYELGYNDVQSFSRFFKKREGVSPNDFRNNN